MRGNRLKRRVGLEIHASEIALQFDFVASVVGAPEIDLIYLFAWSSIAAPRGPDHGGTGFDFATTEAFSVPPGSASRFIRGAAIESRYRRMADGDDRVGKANAIGDGREKT